MLGGGSREADHEVAGSVNPGARLLGSVTCSPLHTSYDLREVIEQSVPQFPYL